MAMHKSKKEYLSSLQHYLNKHPNGTDIVEEYGSYIEDKMLEVMNEGYSLDEAEIRVLNDLPHPKTIANEYVSSQPPNLRQMIIFSLCINVSFFIIGGLLTFSYHQLSNEFVTLIWLSLVELQWVLLVLYSSFIVVLGYLIGKEFGARFNAYIKTVLVLTLTPNIVFMLAVLFSWIPHTWFEPMLTPSFVISCVIVTLLYYPISRLAYRVGQLQI